MLLIKHGILKTQNTEALAGELSNGNISDERKAAIKDRIGFVLTLRLRRLNEKIMAEKSASENKIKPRKTAAIKRFKISLKALGNSHAAEKSTNKDKAKPTEAGGAMASTTDGAGPDRTISTPKPETDDIPADGGMFLSQKDMKFHRDLKIYDAETLKLILKNPQYSEGEKKIIERRIMWTEQGISNSRNAGALARELYSENISDKRKAAIKSRIDFVVASRLRRLNKKTTAEKSASENKIKPRKTATAGTFKISLKALENSNVAEESTNKDKAESAEAGGAATSTTNDTGPDRILPAPKPAANGSGNEINKRFKISLKALGNSHVAEELVNETA
jgi:hypothetical protein